METQPPLDLFTDTEREVASILLDVSSIISLGPFRWGRKRRRTEPPYQFKPEPDRPEPETAGPSSSNEEKTKQEETTSPVTPLCFPNSGSEEQILIPPPVKQVKKPNSQRELLKERRERVAALTKENDDLSREYQQLQERLRKLNAMKFYLKDQNSKLSAAQVGVRALEQLKPMGPTKATNWNAFVMTRQWAPPPPPPPHFQPAIERPVLGFDLNAQPTDDVAECAAAALTCQSDREEMAAKSALARKRRLEIQRERRGLASSAHKRPRVR